MPITPTNPFKGRQFPGEVIIVCVRWYLRYPLAYEHVAELLAERGVAVDPSCIWRWVQVYAPELNKRCRPHLRFGRIDHQPPAFGSDVIAQRRRSPNPFPLAPRRRHLVSCPLAHQAPFEFRER